MMITSVTPTSALQFGGSVILLVWAAVKWPLSTSVAIPLALGMILLPGFFEWLASKFRKPKGGKGGDVSLSPGRGSSGFPNGAVIVNHHAGDPAITLRNLDSEEVLQGFIENGELEWRVGSVSPDPGISITAGDRS